MSHVSGGNSIADFEYSPEDDERIGFDVRPLIKMAIIAAKAVSDHLKIKFKPITRTTAGLRGLHVLPGLHVLIKPSLEGELKVSACFEFLGDLYPRTAAALG